MTTLKQFKEEHFFIEKGWIYSLMLAILILGLIGLFIFIGYIAGYENGQKDNQTLTYDVDKCKEIIIKDFVYNNERKIEAVKE